MGRQQERCWSSKTGDGYENVDVAENQTRIDGERRDGKFTRQIYQGGEGGTVRIWCSIVPDGLVRPSPPCMKKFQFIPYLVRTIFSSTRGERAHNGFVWWQETRFTKVQNRLLAMHADVKAYEILMLVLRLRQLCCHPALIHELLDQEDIEQSGIMDMENVDIDLLSRVNDISFDDIIDVEEEEIDIDKRVAENLLTPENPVFDYDRISSKMKILLDTVKQILQKNNEKLIIVSQWLILLEVIASHLHSIEGATFSKFTGNVAIKDRQSIIDSFNNQNSGPRILLLSLTAGGLGLNLVGGNNLLLFDIHWNPMLKTQVQDRIYRFGQKKDVHIYKFICVNTIEERIKALQKSKLEIAKNVLSGDRSARTTKLTFNDLKSLVGF